MSEISKLIAEIKSEGILRAGNKLEQLYSMAEQMEKDYAALQQKLDAMADKLARSEYYSVGVDAERMEYIKKCNAMAAENAAMRNAIDQTIGWQESTDPENEESVRLLVDLKTPATDAYLNSVRAEGVEMFANEKLKLSELHAGNHDIEMVKANDYAAMSAQEFAEQLRSGTHDTADKAG